MYIRRSIEPTLKRYGEVFPVVLVTGARQVGKSTLLRSVLPEAAYVTLDDPGQREFAQTDPRGFLASYREPLIIDEVQYAPGLFPFIKMHIDADRSRQGRLWLSGSQQFQMMRHVTESLAGRVGILHLAGLSTRELLGDSEAPAIFARLADNGRPKLAPDVVFDRIWLGSYPDVVAGVKRTPEEFYPSYVQTYLERDVRDLARVGDGIAFLKFMRLVAGHTGQLLNVNNLANAADISWTAARHWLSILEASGVILLLEPFGGSSKRHVKAPKLYFMDTGLAAWLGSWSSPAVLAHGAMAGAFLETYVISEIVKGYRNSGAQPALGFYRDDKARELDLAMVENGVFYPLEIKATATPDPRLAKRAMIADQFDLVQGAGAVVCLVPDIMPVGRQLSAFPVGLV